ncbi:MAG: hypothetical protein N3E36_03520 [Sulfolobales archaeon]|nr:hypothetical protein [Sulfolobales archaeon]MCX8199082.1 hypothetical protein [Sulfolobales archaeon]MDW8170061.1 hypothetical protein [Desulfurococcaceae archaeon]
MVASLTKAPVEKRILLIGDKVMCLMGAAAGIDSIEYLGGNCREIEEFLKSEWSKYGVMILVKNVVDECSSLRKFLSELPEEVLVTIVEHPKLIAEADPRKYYEELLKKYIGLLVQL